MIHYGTRSEAVLAELDPNLVLLLRDYADLAPKELDIVLIDGWRSGAEQDADKASGASTKAAGQSKHNVFPARAFDFNVYPAVDPFGGDFARTLALRHGKCVGFMLALAARRGVKLRLGIDWHEPYDPYHVELA